MSWLWFYLWFTVTLMFFVFFEQNTAYEMRISDWSSYVCSSDLIISPLRAATPPATEIVRRAAYDRLPRVKITDLLLEVDARTGFSECFIHRRSGREADDRNALLTVILADGINLGLTRQNGRTSGRERVWQ